MRKIFVCLLLASFAFAQRQRVVVLPSLADAETKLQPKQLEQITEDIRTIITNTLPNTEFNLLKQDEVEKKIGAKKLTEACKEGVCLGSLVEDAEAQFGARCEVYVVERQLYMKFELYGTMKGQSDAGTIGQFSESVKDFADIRAKIRSKTPGIFDMIIKSPQEICEAKGKEWAWVNGACKSTTQISRDLCVANGNMWIGGVCKSQLQLSCESMGKKWVAEQCKSNEQIECEKREGSRWENGLCKSKAQIDRENCEAIGNVWMNGVCNAPVFAAPTGGNTFVARIATIPSGASLSLNGQPYQGCERTPCTISAYGSSVKLSASLSEYKTADTSFTITQPNQLVTIKLEPRTYGVNFSSEPSGASLIFDGEVNSQCKKTPCKVELKRGNVNVFASADLYEGKDTTIFISGGGQNVSLSLAKNYGTLKIRSRDRGWNMAIDDVRRSFGDTKLLPGTYDVKLTHECYGDMYYMVDIHKNRDEVIDVQSMPALKCGTLEIRGNDEWEAVVSGKTYDLQSLSGSMLPSGFYKVLVKHKTSKCYEDIVFDAQVKSGENVFYDIADKIAQKKGGLDLHVKYKGREQKWPVFIDGKEVGNTPFKEQVSVCADKLELGKDKEWVSLYDLKHGKNQEYTKNMPTLKSTLLGLALTTASGVFLGLAYYEHSEANKSMDRYKSLDDGIPYNYDKERKKTKEARDKVQPFLITGGALGVTAIGVFLWL